MSQSDLSGSIIDLNNIRDSAVNDLIRILKSVSSGKKILILDGDLIGPLGLIIPSSLLEKHQVVKLYKLQASKPFDLPTEKGRMIKNVVYIVRPKIEIMKQIAVQVKYLVKKHGNDVAFRVFLVPRRTLICERVLEELGILGDVKLGEYSLDLIPFDLDLLSMEMNSSYKECFLDGDLSSLYYIARAIMKIQAFYGVIPNVKAKGSCSSKILDMIKRMREQTTNDTFNTIPEIDTLILIDRRTDLVSSLFIQLTYEGLIDELFGIQNGFLRPDFKCIPDLKKGQKPAVLLNSNDTVFKEIRDLNQSYVGGVIQKKAAQIEREIGEKKFFKTVSQVTKFAKKLPRLEKEKKNLEMHINIISKINELIGKRDFRKFVQHQQAIILGDSGKDTLDYIEECIDKQEPISKVLRMLGLYSVVNAGLPSKVYDKFRKEIIQTYGYETMISLNNLQKMKIVYKQDPKSNKNWWTQIRKGLDLFHEDMDFKAAMFDIHSVFSGYAPLSVKLVNESLKKGGWKKMKQYLDMLPGLAKEESYNYPPQERKVVMVFYVGGVTMAEVNAYRYLSKNDSNIEYIVATTKLITGDNFIESLI